jgi:hypothetical protein
MHRLKTASSTIFLLACLGLAAGCGELSLGKAYGVLRVGDTRAGADHSVQFDFAEVFRGKSAELFLTLHNEGRAPLTLEGLEWVEAPEPDIFDIDRGDGATTLAAGATERVRVTFRPPMRDTPELPVESYTGVLIVRASGTRPGEDTVRVEVSGRGVHPACQLPASLDFGAVRIGLSHVLTLRIRNHSSSEREVAPAVLDSEGDDARQFRVSGDQSQVQAGEERVVEVRFSPEKERPYAASLQLAAFAGCPAQTITLVGEGRARVLDAEPLDFGFVPVGVAHERSLTVHNFGPQDVVLDGHAVVGAEVFAVSPEGATQSVTVPARGSISLTVSCRPGTLAKHEAALELRTLFALERVLQVPMRCHGGGPQLQVEPSETLDFGRAAFVPATPTPVYQLRELTLRNVGTAYSQLSQERLFLGRGGTAPYFAIEPLNAATGADEFEVEFVTPYYPQYGIHAGSPRNLEVRLTPASVGLKEADLVVYSNDFLRPEVRIRLRAEVFEYAPCQFALRPQLLDFGRVPRGGVRELPLVFENLGTRPDEVCLLSNLRLTSASHKDFSLAAALASQEVLPGERVELRVKVHSTASHVSGVVPITGAVSFHVSSPTSPLMTVPLSAELGDGCLLLSPVALHFGGADPACPGGKSRAIEIRNLCSADIHLDALGIEATAFGDFSVVNAPSLGSGLLLRPFNDAVRFDVVFHPSGLGPRMGSLRIGWRDARGPTSDLVALEGAGTAGGQQTDTFIQRDGQVDLLLALGNIEGPPWYGPELVNDFRYADRMEVLLQHLAALGIDFHIAAVAMGRRYSEELDAMGAFLIWPGSPEPILTPTTPSLLGQLQGKFVWDPLNSELYIPQRSANESSLMALTPPHIHQTNAGFIRPSARLAVLHLNSDYITTLNPPEPPSHYLGQYLGLKGLHRPEDFVLGAFTAVAPGCGIYDGDPAWTMDEALDFFDDPYWLAGPHYRQLAEAAGGMLHNFCSDPGWEDDTETMVEVLTGVRLRFPLSQVPDLTLAPIEVRIDGTTIASTAPVTGETLWSYEQGRSRVRFEFGSLPPKGSTVEVQYRTPCD